MPSSNAPRVSVVVPCFNYGQFLKSSLASITAQTLKPVETLVIDDGSTDRDTLAILHDLPKSGIKIIRQENRGLAGARNTGIRASHGDYIYFVDADDVLFPESLEKLAGLLEQRNDAIAACCGVRLLGGEQNGTEWRASYDPYLILVQNTWAAGLMLRKRSIEELSLWYDESMRHGYEDWEFNIRLVQTGRPIQIHPGALYDYRIHRGSMLVSSRRRHAELVAYIRRKHHRLYAAENLQRLKQQHLPALNTLVRGDEISDIKTSLLRQTFKDYTITEESNSSQVHGYWLSHAGTEALRRLPPEAIECAMMFLELNRHQSHCGLAVRLDGNPSYRGSEGQRAMFQPVAMVTKQHGLEAPSFANGMFAKFETLICFSDQVSSSQSGWQPVELNFDGKNNSHFRDLVSVRKRFSSKIETLLGSRIKIDLVRFYDFVYYRILFSPSALSLQDKLERQIGRRGRAVLSRIFYGAFLALPPSRDTEFHCERRTDPLPLFFDADESDTSKNTLLIVTGWLNQGGIEQEILDLCRNLASSRFKLVIATTRQSFHPWENVLRPTGPAIYHLASFLRPHEIPYGLAHLILQHGIKVMHIIHSREAYVALPFLKRLCPFLAISDRNVTDASGFPKISARLGRDAIDLRTVGHHKLARQMSKAYGLADENLRVIYAGTDLQLPQLDGSIHPPLLHSLCGLPQDVPIVLYLGRLDPEKRPEIFVRVADRICKMRPDCLAHFAMAGDGEMRDKIAAHIAKLGLGDRVHLIGFHLNGSQLIRDSSILMITSRYEGLALVSFEAMAVGTPQISADVGGQSELVTPDIGILVKTGIGEVDRFARACIELLCDHKRRESMSAASRQKFTKQYTAEHCSREYSQVFEELAELSRRRGDELSFLRPPHINPLNAFG